MQSGNCFFLFLKVALSVHVLSTAMVHQICVRPLFFLAELVVRMTILRCHGVCFLTELLVPGQLELALGGVLTTRESQYPSYMEVCLYYMNLDGRLLG